MPQNITIPEVKRVKLKKGKGQNSVLSNKIPLILDQDITLSVSSSFSPLLGGGGGGEFIDKLIQIAGTATGTGSTSFKQFGIQTWDSTDPLSVNLTVTFYMGIADLYDAKKEVFVPVVELMALTLPKEGGAAGTLIPPGPSIVQLIQSIASASEQQSANSAQSQSPNQGQNPLAQATEKITSSIGETAENVANYISGINPDITENQNLTLKIGKILDLKKVLVKKAEPTFSNEVDEDGYPIWATVSLDVQSLMIATKDMIRRPLS